MSSLEKFIKAWSVYSKTAGKPVTATHEGVKYVFIEGWPMTVKTYSLLTLQSVFGGGARLRVDEWEALHAETRLLCTGLCLPHLEGHEAFAIVKLFRNIMNISAASMYDQQKITNWVALLDEKIQSEEDNTETGTD